MIRSTNGFLVCFLLTSVGCTNCVHNLHDEVALVEKAARRFVGYAHDFEYEALRQAATHDFEMFYDGRRWGMTDFVRYLMEIEDRRGGRKLSDYEIFDVSSRIVGNVAYLSYSSERWLESFILVWSNDRWLVSRSVSMRVRTD